MEKSEFNELSDRWTSNDWEKIFKKVRHNPIFFIDFFWNVAYPEKAVELTENQKQKYFDKHKGAPFFNDINDAFEYSKWTAEMKAKGYKDWEIM